MTDGRIAIAVGAVGAMTSGVESEDAATIGRSHDAIRRTALVIPTRIRIRKAGLRTLIDILAVDTRACRSTTVTTMALRRARKTRARIVHTIPCDMIDIDRPIMDTTVATEPKTSTKASIVKGSGMATTWGITSIG
jgi:hypothetical protein